MAKQTVDNSAKIQVGIASLCLVVGVVLMAYNLGLIGGGPRTAKEANLKPSDGTPSKFMQNLPAEQKKDVDEAQAILEENYKASPPQGS